MFTRSAWGIMVHCFSVEERYRREKERENERKKERYRQKRKQEERTKRERDALDSKL